MSIIIRFAASAKLNIPRWTKVILAGVSILWGACREDPSLTSPSNPPVLHLAMEGNLSDSGSYGLEAEAIGEEIEFSDGVVGRAVFVGGTDDWIEARVDRPLSFPHGATLELWFKRGDWVNPYSKGSGAQTIANLGGFTIYLEVDSAREPDRNRLKAGLRSADEWTDLVKRTAVPAGVWKHVALVHDAKARLAQLYVDGRRVEIRRAPPPKPVDRFVLGTWVGQNQAFNGWIDELRLFDYPRSGAQVRAAAARANG